MSVVSPETPPQNTEHLCQLCCGCPVRRYYQGVCLMWLGLGESTGTGVLGPNQQKTAKWLKSRSTSSHLPACLPHISLHVPIVTVTPFFSIPHLSISFLCLSRSKWFTLSPSLYFPEIARCRTKHNREGIVREQSVIYPENT